VAVKKKIRHAARALCALLQPHPLLSKTAKTTISFVVASGSKRGRGRTMSGNLGEVFVCNWNANVSFGDV